MPFRTMPWAARLCLGPAASCPTRRTECNVAAFVVSRPPFGRRSCARHSRATQAAWTPSMRKPSLIPAVASGVVLSTVVGVGVAAGSGNQSDGHRNNPYEIGLIGDMRYGPTGRAQFPNVIADINTHRLAFTTFDGDIKNG